MIILFVKLTQKYMYAVSLTRGLLWLLMRSMHYKDMEEEIYTWTETLTFYSNKDNDTKNDKQA